MGKPSVNAAWFHEGFGEIVTPRGRMLYPVWLTPRPVKGFEENGAKFSGMLLFPEDVNIELLGERHDAAAKDALGKDFAKKKQARWALQPTEDHEHAQKFAEEYPYVLSANAYADGPPRIYTSDYQPFDGEPSEIYGGRWAIYSGVFRGYSKGKGGTNFVVKRIFLLKNDERLTAGGPPVDSTEGFEGLGLNEGESASDAFLLS